MSDGQTRETILITGASGLIGTRLARAFSSEFRVVGLDVKPPADEKVLDDFIEADLTSNDSVRHALEEVQLRHGDRIASVIHLAAYYDFTGEPSPMYEKLTVQGTRRLLQTLHELYFKVEQFVFSSSILVMEPDKRGKHISEYSPTQAEWDYPRSKLEAEQVIREERGHYPSVVLRMAGVYDEECHSLPLSQQIARIYEKQLESYVFPGDKTHGQALVHLDDLTACFRCTVERRAFLGAEALFLIAEPDVMSYEELQDELGELIHGSEWPTIRIPKTLAKAGAWVQEKIAGSDEKPFIKPWMIDIADDHYAATISHARTKLHWEPQHRLRDTLPAIVAFLKRDPQHFYEVNGLPIPDEAAHR